MRKILAFTAIFACVFAFASCKDEEEKDELKSVQYTIEALFDEDFTGIAIWEEGKSKKEILKTNSLHELQAGNKVTYTSAKGCKSVTIYAKGDNLGCFKQEKSFLGSSEKIVLGGGISPISEQDYNFYTK